MPSKYQYITIVKVANGYIITAFNNETCLEETYTENHSSIATQRVGILLKEIIHES